MNKAEAIKIVVEVATFWRAEDLRTVGSLVELEDADTVTCDNEQAMEALNLLGNMAFLDTFNKIYMEGQVNKMTENERAQELTEIARAWIDCCGAFIEDEDGEEEILQFDDISQIADDGKAIVRMGFTLDDLNEEIYSQIHRGYR